MSHTGHRVLLIVADPAASRPLATRLRRRGHRVLVAEMEGRWLDHLDPATTETIVIDGDPRPAGDLRKIRRITASTATPPVIVLSGTYDSHDAASLRKAGATEYVVKDDDGAFVEHLDLAIRAAVNRIALRRGLEAAEREIHDARDRHRASAAERDSLLREVNHRVGNSLQLVGAILHMQAGESSSQDTRRALDEANRRVMAVAQIHRRLHATGDVKAVALDAYLAGLLDDLRDGTSGRPDGRGLSLDAEAILTDPDRAVTVGLIVTELVIEAQRRSGVPGADIRVTLKSSETPHRYALTVESDGSSPPVAVQQGRLSRTVIGAMASKLDSRVDYASSEHGSRVELILTLPDVA